MTTTTNLPTLGFIGIGVMGKSMVSHLLKGGYQVNIYNRTAAKAEELIDKGAIWQGSPAEVAAVADITITIVGYPKDVEAVYFGEKGIIRNSRRGSTLIDMTTSSPELAGNIYAACREAGLAALDAPVSGGDVGAKNGTLSIMIGGDVEVYQRVKPIFELMGENIVYQGSAGAGQHCKMANQMAIASTMMGVCEAIRYAEKAGLDPTTVLKSIAAGAAGSWSLSNLAPRMIRGDFEPGFYVKHFIKDMAIALASCENLGLDARGLALAKSMYEELAEQEKGDKGTQVLYTYYK